MLDTGIAYENKKPQSRKSPDFSRSVWAGVGTRDFRDVSVADLAADVQRKMGWSQRRIELPGRPGEEALHVEAGEIIEPLRDRILAAAAADLTEPAR